MLTQGPLDLQSIAGSIFYLTWLFTFIPATTWSPIYRLIESAKSAMQRIQSLLHFLASPVTMLQFQPPVIIQGMLVALVRGRLGLASVQMIKPVPNQPEA
jgi:hypothetical protein